MFVYLVGCLVVCLIGLLLGCLVVKLFVWLFGRLFSCLFDWLFGCVVGSVCFFVRLMVYVPFEKFHSYGDRVRSINLNL